jgi:hypothetical protein
MVGTSNTDYILSLAGNPGTIAFNGTSPTGAVLNTSGSAAMTAGQASILYTITSVGKLTASAEL